MKQPVVLESVARFLLPFIVVFALYIQLHGDYSPGGGFQAGVIAAAAFILYALVFGMDAVEELLPWPVVQAGCSMGVLLYGGVGIAAIIQGGSFLNYSVLDASPVAGQHLGILLIELGVGITVFSVMVCLFYLFAGWTQDSDV